MNNIVDLATNLPIHLICSISNGVFSCTLEASEIEGAVAKALFIVSVKI